MDTTVSQSQAVKRHAQAEINKEDYMRKSNFLLLVLGLFLIGALALNAQTQTEKSTSGSSAKSPLTMREKMFVKDVAQGGLAEVEMGTLAKDKASSADVKEFGNRMV